MYKFDKAAAAGSTCTHLASPFLHHGQPAPTAASPKADQCIIMTSSTLLRKDHNVNSLLDNLKVCNDIIFYSLCSFIVILQFTIQNEYIIHLLEFHSIFVPSQFNNKGLVNTKIDTLCYTYSSLSSSNTKSSSPFPMVTNCLSPI